jgi:hypothetical protein
VAGLNRLTSISAAQRRLYAALIGSNGHVCVSFGSIKNAYGGSNVTLDVGYLTNVATRMPLLTQTHSLVDAHLG